MTTPLTVPEGYSFDNLPLEIPEGYALEDGPRLSTADRYKMGIADPVYGAGQLGARMDPELFTTPGSTMPEIFGNKDDPLAAFQTQNKGIDQLIAKREADYQDQRQAQSVVDSGGWGKYTEPGLDLARLAGNATSPMNLLPVGVPGTGLASKLGAGAAQGLYGALTQPVTDVDPNSATGILGPKAGQAAFGGTMGAAAGPVGSAVAGAISPAAKLLQTYGAKLLPSMTGGPLARLAEGLAERVPIAKNLAQADLGKTIGTYARGAYNYALSPLSTDGSNLISGDLSKMTTAQTSQQAHDILTKGYGDLLPKMTYNPTSDNADTVLNGLQTLRTSLQQQTPENVGIFDRSIAPMIQDGLSGDSLKQADTMLKQSTSGALKDPTMRTQILGQHLDEAHNLFLDQLERENSPDAVTQLKALNKAYAGVSVADKAARKGLADEGDFTPNQLTTATAQNEGMTGSANQRLLQGKALLQPYADAGREVIGSNRAPGNRPLTASDMIIGDLVGTGLGVGAGLGAGAAGEEGVRTDNPLLKYGAVLPAAAFAVSPMGRRVMSTLGPGNLLRRGLGSVVTAAPAAMGADQFEQELRQRMGQ